MLGIPAKLIRHGKMTLSNFCNSVKFGIDVCESFARRQSLIMRPSQFCHREHPAKSGRAFQWLYFTIKPSVACICCRHWHYRAWDVTAAFIAIERESTKMCVTANEGKTKYLLTTSRDVLHIWSQITIENYTFDILKKFIYIGFAVTTKYDFSLEIKSSITLIDRYYYGLNRQLSRRELSFNAIFYKTLILTVLLYGAEAKPLLSTNATAPVQVPQPTQQWTV